MKYILVTGGVISGIGKGVVASSLGVILKVVTYQMETMSNWNNPKKTTSGFFL